jgi:hypothetical protein
MIGLMLRNRDVHNSADEESLRTRVSENKASRAVISISLRSRLACLGEFDGMKPCITQLIKTALELALQLFSTSMPTTYS